MNSPTIHPDKVAIYVRWSTDEQTEGTTLQVQLEACQAFLTSQGWHPNPKLTFIDDGYSGGTLERPAITELRKQCRQGLIDCVVVFKLDRLSRSVLDTVNLVLKEWADKVYLKSAREPVDTATAMGKQFFYMLISYAEWERNVIRERTMSGRLKRAQEGKHLTRPPYGYTHGETRGQRVIVPEQAEIVRQIYQRYLAGMGDRQIAGWLNDMGVKTLQGNAWHPNTVRNLLTNPLYAGVIRFGHKSPASSPTGAGRPRRADPFLVEVESATPAIITREVFDAAQEIRAGESQKMAGRAKTSPHLLTGLLRCKCGAGVQFKQINNKSRDKNGHKFGYYLCCKKFAYGAKGCTSGFLPAAEVDDTVVKEFMNRFGDPSTRLAKLEEMLDGDLVLQTKTLQERLQGLQNERERLSKGFARLDADYLAGELPARRYDELKAQSEEALKSVASEIRQLEAQLESRVVYDARRQALAVQLNQVDHWETLTVEQQKQLLATFLDSIVVYRPLRSNTWECELRWRGDTVSLEPAG